MTRDKATKRPWRVKTYKEFYIKFTCIESNGGRIAKIKHYPHYGDTEANAKLIVKAVNYHDELVNILKDIIETYEYGKCGDYIEKDQIIKAKQALSKLESED